MVPSIFRLREYPVGYGGCQGETWVPIPYSMGVGDGLRVTGYGSWSQITHIYFRPSVMRTHRIVGFVLVAGLVSACAHSGGKDPSDRPYNPTSDPTLTQPALTSEDIERNPGASLEDLMATRFPGVIVSRTESGGISIRIRGASSFVGNSEPLYVIDGVPMEVGREGLTGINLHDIESIEVLKDPPNTSLYGVRGANGVVVITTKRPRR